MTKIYRVSYYQWAFNRYGDKDFTVMEHWADDKDLNELQADSSVDDLEIHEEREVA